MTKLKLFSSAAAAAASLLLAGVASAAVLYPTDADLNGLVFQAGSSTNSNGSTSNTVGGEFTFLDTDIPDTSIPMTGVYTNHSTSAIGYTGGVDELSLVIFNSNGNVWNWDVQVFDTANTFIGSLAQNITNGTSERYEVSLSGGNGTIGALQLVVSGGPFTPPDGNADAVVFVPAPAPVALIGLGLLGLASRLRKSAA